MQTARCQMQAKTPEKTRQPGIRDTLMSMQCIGCYAGVLLSSGQDSALCNQLHNGILRDTPGNIACTGLPSLPHARYLTHSLATVNAHSFAIHYLPACLPAWSGPSIGLGCAAVCRQLALTMGTGSMSVIAHLQNGQIALMLQTALAHSMHMPWWHDVTRTSMSASMQMLHSSTSGSAAACRQQLSVCLWFRPSNA